MDEKLIAQHMRTLGCTRDEAIQLIQDDKAVDKGEAMPWDLTPEQMKNARKLANAGTRKVSKPTTRTKKENPVKQAIIAAIENAMQGCREVNSVQISNAERTVDIVDTDGIQYTITLTAHRSK